MSTCTEQCRDIEVLHHSYSDSSSHVAISLFRFATTKTSPVQKGTKNHMAVELKHKLASARNYATLNTGNYAMPCEVEVRDRDS